LYLGINLLTQAKLTAEHSTGFYCLSHALADRLYAEEMADGKFQHHCNRTSSTDDMMITELIDKKMGVRMRWPGDYLLGMHMQVPW
jgi:hypothetical protein